MKRLAFASIEFVYDFDTEEEAKRFVVSNQGKGWYFDGEPKPLDDADGTYTLTVRKPYKNYNPGW